jgi:preprotein translocase subunit YajC
MSRKAIKIISISLIVLLFGLIATGCYPMTGTTAQGDTGTGTEEVEEPTGIAGVFAKYGTWIWLAILAVAFYFLLIRPQRQRSKKAKELLEGVKRGDEVLTIGGFHGRVKDVQEESVIITIASGVDVKVSKSAISKNMSATNIQK